MGKQCCRSDVVSIERLVDESAYSPLLAGEVPHDETPRVGATAFDGAKHSNVIACRGSLRLNLNSQVEAATARHEN